MPFLDREWVRIFSQAVFDAFREKKLNRDHVIRCICHNCYDDMHQAVEEALKKLRFELSPAPKQSGKRRTTAADKEVVRQRLFGKFDPNTEYDEYTVERNKVAQELGLTNNQIGTILTWLRNEQKDIPF